MPDETLPSIQETELPARVDQLPANATLPQFLAAALLDDRVQPEKLRELLAIQREIRADEAERLFNEAFARLQEKLPVMKRTRKIEVKGKVRSKYSAYEDIYKQIRPLLRPEGFGTKYDTEITGKTAIKVILTLKHVAGHKELTEVTLPLDESEFRNAVQNYGSTITFAKRYALTLALDIASEDEDNDATGLSYVTPQEAETIRDLMHECGMAPGSDAESKFLVTMSAKSIDDISRGAYPVAVNLLNAKRRGLGKQP